ncbi:MAG: VOC family protein [bacterium]|nr:VOC family protein [bacterium]
MGMEHVAINVKDPGDVVDWFVANLDMTVARKVGGPTNTHFLADAMGKSMIEVYHNLDAPVPDYANQDPLVLHLAFTVDDVTAVRDRLLAAGATPEGDIVVTDSGDELAMLRSPHGIAVQLVKRADPMLK